MYLMKIAKLCIVFIFSQQLFAQEFIITPLEEGLDLSSLDSNIKVKSINEFKEKKYISPKKRDAILYNSLGDKISQLDEMDRDVLYKSIIYYSEERLISKYPFLKSVDLKVLKKELVP